jgi:hypothetical protein
MAEDDFLSTRAGQFRGSRYPGFVGGMVSPSNGLGSQTAGISSSAGSLPSANGGGAASNSLGAMVFDVPKVEAPSMGEMASNAGTMVAGGAAQYAGGKIGANTGAALATSSGVGDAISTGAGNFAKDIGRTFGIGSTAGQKVYSSSSSVGPFASEAGSGVAGEAVGSTAGNTAGSTAGSAAGGAAGSQAGGHALGNASASSIGGAVGSGVVATALSLAQGRESKLQSVGRGAGTAFGTYVGTAFGGPVGGMVGGAIGGELGSYDAAGWEQHPVESLAFGAGHIGKAVASIFCFAAGTLTRMADGSFKPIEALDIGDVTELGGKVIACGKALANEDLYRYRGEVVSGSHAVFEAGAWLRVEDSVLAEKIETPEGVLLYPVCTENMLLVTRAFIAADMTEVENTWDHTEEQRIHMLNLDHVRNGLLRADERRLGLIA